VRNLYVFAAAFLGCATPHVANAGDQQPGASCDFFQNAVLGTRCAQSFSFAAAVSYDQSTVRYNDGFINETDRSRLATTTASLSLTPTNWLTLGFHSSHHDYSISARYSDSFGNSGSDTYKASATGAQDLTANINLLDTSTGGQKYVVNVFAGAAYIPSYKDSGSETIFHGGLRASGQWPLGQSGYAISSTVHVNSDRKSRSENVFLHPSINLLLSHNASGIAFGPKITSTYWVSSSNPNASDYVHTHIQKIGGVVIYQPFRASQSALLNGLIIEGSALTSVGQDYFGKAKWYREEDSTIISGSAKFNMRY
jgi:hypothetical protein